MTAFDINYTKYFSRGEWFWRLGQADISENTLRLFDEEEIDGEAFGIMMTDNQDYAWLQENLGQLSSDLEKLNALWAHEKDSALRLLDNALREARLAVTPRRTYDTLEEVARRLSDDFDAVATPGPAVVTDSETETDDESDDDADHSAGYATEEYN